MKKANNICPWLKRGTIERCGKHCVDEYCNTHRQEFRLGRKVLVPCHKCGKGTASSTLHCKLCGSHRIYQKLLNTEKRARRDFALVLICLKNPIREICAYYL